jgi:hypothetical protein
MADTGTLDPFDVEALEKSLNDSATRVSTIWISFLIFSLYLLTAAATVTHRQLLLDQPVKLPVLSIDLPLRGFFFLAPILFVIFHIYVLLQVLLLGRTAAAYNEALDRAALSPPSNAAMRQRLANTLLAQIFAGSPREDEDDVIEAYMSRKYGKIIHTADIKDEMRRTMQERLLPDPAADNTAATARAWSDCANAAASKPQDQFDGDAALFVRNLVCDSRDNRNFIVNNIARTWTYKDIEKNRPNFAVPLARGLLGEDGRNCAAAADLNEALKGALRDLIAEAAKTAPPK